MSGTMSDEQGSCCGGRGNAQSDNHRTTNAGLDEGSVVTTTLPVTTNQGCCSAGVGRDEIAGTNGSREVGGLGQVLTLVSTRGQGSVTAGCGCGPDVDASLSEEKGQTPLGIDARDGAPFDFVGRDDVANVHAGLADDEARSPESSVNDRDEERRNADSAQTVDQSTCCGGGCCGTTENSDEHGGNDSAGARRERGHEVHVVTEVTR
jgi:hypothetical protein